ncbi:hypothetical protein L3X38_039172 [Prunus dulcis]|uniref:Uncharacterized protein n=1 Tax=Prunus dulcis TaxID=3755 RepID=A0AAD4YSC1_PRUDU|nr:hypothetical protein L3X38_039172 [Prunus dulcis]
MAFIISRAPPKQKQPSFSEAEKKDGHKELSEAQSSSITSHVYLKSSAGAAMDRDVVLRRIRHHKNLSKVKSAFQSLMGSSQEAASVTSVDQTWLHQEDTFSSP